MQTIFTKYLNLIEQTIKNETDRFNFSDQRQILKQACEYSLSAKAKRIRPLLVILSFLLFKEEKDLHQILPLAIAIEIIHTFSLIHDDLPSMDNDDFRRGQPTCHKKFNEAVAILAGDTLNTLAFEILAKDLKPYFSAEKILLIIEQLAGSTGLFGMVGGQILDMQAAKADKSADYLMLMHSLKTGALLKASVTLPAILCNATEKEIETLGKFGANIGLLFQIIDDILDVTQNKETLGKSVGKDIIQNKLTYVTLWGIEKAKLKAEKEYQNAKNSLEEIKYLNPTLLNNLLEYIYKRNF